MADLDPRVPGGAMADDTFELDLEGAEFVLDALQRTDPNDLFTEELWRWVSEQLEIRHEREEYRAHQPGAVFRLNDRGLPTIHVVPAPPEGWPRD